MAAMTSCGNDLTRGNAQIDPLGFVHCFVEFLLSLSYSPRGITFCGVRDLILDLRLVITSYPQR